MSAARNSSWAILQVIPLDGDRDRFRSAEAEPLERHNANGVRLIGLRHPTEADTGAVATVARVYRPPLMGS